MNGPKKNRLHDYEAGWLTLLVEMGVAPGGKSNRTIVFWMSLDMWVLSF